MLQEHEEPNRLPSTPALTVEVNQPDLGTVRVRVAQSDRTVHAQVITEQAEVGRFLMMQEDRLDARFQASGFDLGQFHVHVGTQGQYDGRERGPSTMHDGREQPDRLRPPAIDQTDQTDDRTKNGRPHRMLSVIA
jgi:flagellar hook-length control protein FliK